jgi:hypothetical protein
MERTTLRSLLDDQGCISLSCHKDMDNSHYMLVLNPVKCIGCGLCLSERALIIREESFNPTGV